MKKEYISPEAIAIKIQTMGMLAVSGFDDAINPSDPNPITDVNDMLAPENNFDFSEAFKDDFSE